MGTQLPATPSWREFLVYRRMAIEGRSVANVCAEFDLTEPQVHEAADQVAAYLLAAAPLKNSTVRQRNRAITLLVGIARLRFAHGEAIEAYRASLQDKKVVRTRYFADREPQTTTTVRRGKAQVSYLKSALQLSPQVDHWRQELRDLGWDDADLAPIEAALCESGVAEPNSPPLA